MFFPMDLKYSTSGWVKKHTSSVSVQYNMINLSRRVIEFMIKMEPFPLRNELVSDKKKLCVSWGIFKHCCHQTVFVMVKPEE